MKTFLGQVYWIPVDDPGSSHTLDISALSDPVAGVFYNNMSDQVLLPESNNIWQMSVFDDTKTLFADVGKFVWRRVKKYLGVLAKEKEKN